METLFIVTCVVLVFMAVGYISYGIGRYVAKRPGSWLGKIFEPISGGKEWGK